MWGRVLLGGTFAVLLALVVAVAVGFPAVAATACPGCYGLERVRKGLHVEPGAGAEQRAQVSAAVAEGTRRVAAFFGDLRSDPEFLACLTDRCYARIGGGGECGVAVLNRAVMLSPRGIDPVIAAHELTHVELRARVGKAVVPQWFDEGLAVLVADDPRYLRPAGTGDRCLVAPTGPLPETLDDWLRAASADPGVYAQAACAVSRWTTAHDARAHRGSRRGWELPPGLGPAPIRSWIPTRTRGAGRRPDDRLLGHRRDPPHRRALQPDRGARAPPLRRGPRLRPDDRRVRL
ncbi:hypothetical protein GCM10023320_03800 [Pseudonocardia adelaidensis]|uniref:Peptidase MA superfamily protein n=2 Tax=Pseudonocardia adelaidensis TaxID=648754 RepID=A0ABP9NAN9_9PSEU